MSPSTRSGWTDVLMTCPGCGARFSLEAAVDDAEARAALVAAFELSELGPRIATYIALFRPPKRALAWRRVRRLVTELVEAVGAGCIERRGRVHAVRAEAWAVALDQVLEARDRGKLRTPLRDHAYLWEVVIGHSERLSGKEEIRHDVERRGRPRPGAGPDKGPKRIDPEATQRGIKAGWAALGRTRPDPQEDLP